jgi:starch synthase (maltosyl-transferring)
MESINNYRRVVIETISPEIDSGRFPAKAIAGDVVTVEADIYADGHDTLSARLFYRRPGEDTWNETPMHHLINDRWQGSFMTEATGNYTYTINAFIDDFLTWRADFMKRISADEKDLGLHLVAGAGMLNSASKRARGQDAQRLAAWADRLESGPVTLDKLSLALDNEIALLMEKYSDRSTATTYPRELVIKAERERAGYGAWYEMFPRSLADSADRLHGTFRDCEARLPYIAEMGFDVLYLPPIHPTGSTCRKGKNNMLTCVPGDPGTPWAIGSEEGGHKAIDQKLGTLADFRRLITTAKEFNIEIAMDMAFQCSPDHPWVQEHPDWFLRRSDGTIQYAENPPKKYQDIYPLNFASVRWKELWAELKSVVIYWAEQGVRIFRVDNPHTKPFDFWEWLITEVKKDYPDVIFLAEAFTRPKVMYRLAKIGFTQSYTYFTWRNNRQELTDYLNELTKTNVKDFFRPNFWPNTPDILHEYLQKGGRPAFITRLVLAATLCSSYGIYGPAFELFENTPRDPGSEEYLNSEKYEIKHWDVNRADSLKDFIGQVNRIRRENLSLQRNRNLWFNATSNDQLICYSKHTDDISDIILVVVNLDPRHPQSGMVNVPLQAWGLNPQQVYPVHDLLNDKHYTWRGEWNPVDLNPEICPAHIFRVEASVRLPPPMKLFNNSTGDKESPENR